MTVSLTSFKQAIDPSYMRTLWCKAKWQRHIEWSHRG